MAVQAGGIGGDGVETVTRKGNYWVVPTGNARGRMLRPRLLEHERKGILVFPVPRTTAAAIFLLASSAIIYLALRISA